MKTLIERMIFGPLLMILLICGSRTANAVQVEGVSFQQCLQDLCGSDYTVEERFRSANRTSETKNLSELENTNWGQQLTQKVDAYYDWYEEWEQFGSEQEEEAFIGQIREGVRRIIDSPTSGLETFPIDGQMGMFFFMEASEVITDYYESGNNYSPQKERHRELVDAYKDFLSLPTTNFSNANDYSAENFLRLKYGDLSFQEALLQYIDYATSVQNREQNNTEGVLNSVLGLPKNLEELKIKAQDRSITEQEIKTLLESHMMLPYLEILLDYQDRHGEEIAAEFSLELQSWLGQKTPAEKEQLVAEISDKTREDDESESSKEERLFSKEACLRSFQKNVSLYPRQQEVEQFKDFIAREHRDLVQKINTSSHIPETSKSTLVAEIEKLSMIYPLSREDYQSKFMQRLDGRLVQMQERDLEIFDNFKNDVQHSALFLLMLKMKGLSDEEEEQEEMETDFADFCKETFNVDDDFGSSTVAAWDVIKFGASAILGSRSYARQVFYHEIGHNLKRMLELNTLERLLKGENVDVDLDMQQLFAPARTCLQDRQDRISGRGEFYLGEDFADLIAATFEDSSSRPFACEYFWMGADSGRFYGQDSLINSNVKDDHSSDLLRALFNSIDRGMGLPASCQTALEEAGHPDFQERQCSLF